MKDAKVNAETKEMDNKQSSEEERYMKKTKWQYLRSHILWCLSEILPHLKGPDSSSCNNSSSSGASGKEN